MVRRLIGRLVLVLVPALALALGSLLAIGPAAARKSGRCSPPSGPVTPAANLIGNRDYYLDRRLTVEGFVVPGLGGCVDMVCPDGAACCGTCSASAMLAGVPAEADPERLVFLGLRDGHDPAFGHCHDSSSCEQQCVPPARVRLRLTGRLRNAPDSAHFYFEVERYCTVER